jgi:hypothetical protein
LDVLFARSFLIQKGMTPKSMYSVQNVIFGIYIKKLVLK